MPYVLHREDGITVALDEAGPRLIITQYNAEQNADCLLALVPLPANGIEVLDWSPPVAEDKTAEVADLAKRAATAAHPAWRQPRPA